MALTEQVESMIRFMWEEALITDSEREVLQRKLSLCSRGIYTELSDDSVTNVFEAETLEEKIIRAALRDKAYRLPESDFRWWLNYYFIKLGRREC